MSRRPFNFKRAATGRKCVIRGLGRGRPRVVTFQPGGGEAERQSALPAASSKFERTGVLFEKQNSDEPEMDMEMETERPFLMGKPKSAIKEEWDSLLPYFRK